MSSSIHGQWRGSFTVPGTSGQYAPEILYLNQGAATTIPRSQGGFDRVAELQLMIEALPASAVIEVDILEPGTDPATAANWTTAVQTYSATGLQSILALARVQGVRVRAKSGGTSGTATFSAWWH